MTTPHTDAEVLSGAIDILEHEGMWCQGSYYKTDQGMSDKKLAFCAEGAIREVAGYWNVVAGTAVSDDKTKIDGIAYLDLNRLTLLSEQCVRLEDLVLKHSGGQLDIGLNGFNDDENTTVADVLLAMKKALNEVENDSA